MLFKPLCPPSVPLVFIRIVPNERFKSSVINKTYFIRMLKPNDARSLTSYWFDEHMTWNRVMSFFLLRSFNLTYSGINCVLLGGTCLFMMRKLKMDTKLCCWGLKLDLLNPQVIPMVRTVDYTVVKNAIECCLHCYRILFSVPWNGVFSTIRCCLPGTML